MTFDLDGMLVHLDPIYVSYSRVIITASRSCWLQDKLHRVSKK